MIFNAESYILHTYDIVGEDDMEYVYVYCESETIPLECFDDLPDTTSEHSFEGHLIHINGKSKSPFNLYLFTEGKWYTALKTNSREKFLNRKIKIRNLRIGSIIN